MGKQHTKEHSRKHKVLDKFYIPERRIAPQEVGKGDDSLNLSDDFI